jgi:superfamily II DNA or RNA helicase
MGMYIFLLLLFMPFVRSNLTLIFHYPIPKMNQLITLDNKSCQFLTENETDFNLLKSFLSYKMQGVEFTPSYQAGWNGITYLMNKKGIFLSGLLPQARSFLTENDISFAEEDRRKPIVPAPEIDLTHQLQELSLIPREHQNRIVQAALSNNKGIVRSCTGSGKTLATALITAKLNKPTTLYVIGLDLLQQFHDLFSKLFDEPIGYIGNGIYQVERINIATIWTVARALKLDKKSILSDDEGGDEEEFDESQSEAILRMLQQSKVHIFDESHICATNTIHTILKSIDPERIYGFSGTPYRGDNTDLLINGILGQQIINVSASELIEKNLLAQPIIKFMPVPKMRFSGGTTYPGVYKEYIVENDLRNQMVVQETVDLIAKKYTPLVLFKQIKHGKILSSMMEKAGVKCVMLYGNDSLDRRIEVKQMLIEGEIEAILASTIFDIGIDIVQLNALVLAGGGKSAIRTLQRVGRVLRIYPGKTIAAVVDFYDQAKYLKGHSTTRYDVYCSEDGFKVHPCAEMK